MKQGFSNSKQTVGKHARSTSTAACISCTGNEKIELASGQAFPVPFKESSGERDAISIMPSCSTLRSNSHISSFQEAPSCMYSSAIWNSVPTSVAMLGTLNDVFQLASGTRSLPDSSLQLAMTSSGNEADELEKSAGCHEWISQKNGGTTSSSSEKGLCYDSWRPVVCNQRKPTTVGPISSSSTTVTTSCSSADKHLRDLGSSRLDGLRSTVSDGAGGSSWTFDSKIMKTSHNSQTFERAPPTVNLSKTESSGSMAGLFTTPVLESGSLLGLQFRNFAAVPIAKDLQQSGWFAHQDEYVRPRRTLNFPSSESDPHAGILVNEHIHLAKKQRTQAYGDLVTQAGKYSTSDHDSDTEYGKPVPHLVVPFARVLDSNTSCTPMASFLRVLPPNSTSTTTASVPNVILSGFGSLNSQFASKDVNGSLSRTSSTLDSCSYIPEPQRQANQTCFARSANYFQCDKCEMNPTKDLNKSQRHQTRQSFMYPGSSPRPFCLQQCEGPGTGNRPAWCSVLGNVSPLKPTFKNSTAIASSRSHELEHLEGLNGASEGRTMSSVPEVKTRLVIQKQLTTTDVGSLGRIILPKKEAESHLPQLPDKEGFEMCLYDYDVDRTWIMKYRYWPNNKSRMYLLENTGQFARFHDLQQGDLLLIYREPSSRYILRVKKMALPATLTVALSPSKTEDSENLTSAQSSMKLSSTSTKALAVGTVAPCSEFNQQDLFTSGTETTACPSAELSMGVVPLRQKVVPKAEALDRSRMHIPGQECQKELDATILDSAGMYNFEEFPSLIDAEVLMETIFPPQCESSRV